MNEPLVSVVVATYRRDSSLKSALVSLVEQNYLNFETILVSDNADDEWNEKISSIVDVFKTEHSNVSIKLIINEENRGSAEARNIGIRIASGEYITFLDDDDLYLPNKIENQVRYMVQNQLDYCITDLYLYDEKDRLIDKRTRTYILKYDFNSLLEYHLKYHMTGTDSMMFRKDYLLKIGGFPPINVGDEFYLMKEAISAGGKFGYLPECKIKAYVHTNDDGLSSGESKINGENALFEFKKTMFYALDCKSIRYIKMRHYAVLSFAAFRMKKILKFIKYSFHSFFTSPVDCINLLRSLI